MDSEDITSQATNSLQAQQVEDSPSNQSVTEVATATGPVSSLNPRVEVSAQTIARMMGIASATDLQLLEGRIDLLASRVSTLMMKVDKVLAAFGTVAGAGDIGRLETQIASMKSILREAVESISSAQEGRAAGERESGALQSRRLKEGIRSSNQSE